MENRVDLIIRHDERDKFEVENVPLDELEVLTRKGWLEVLQIRAIVENVQADKLNGGILLGHEIAHVRADKTSSTCDQNTVRNILGWFNNRVQSHCDFAGITTMGGSKEVSR
jgi:hypothetical protein